MNTIFTTNRPTARILHELAEAHKRHDRAVAHRDAYEEQAKSIMEDIEELERQLEESRK